MDMAQHKAEIECLIIGGGPAGLTAATYLGRFLRRALLVDAGASRAAWIPETHNLIGFAEGISGPVLLDRLRKQADLYDSQRLDGQIDSLEVSSSGGFRATIGEQTIVAQRILLATGGLDVEPDLPGIRQAVETGLVRYCPICDGFEAKGRRVALIAYGKCRIKEALLLRGYTADLTVLTLGREMQLPDDEQHQLQAAGIKIVRDPVVRLSREVDGIGVWPQHAGNPAVFDILYSALGTRIASSLATRLGAEADEDGALIVDRNQRTNVPGLYAAGDVVQGLSQINIAAAQAAIAATSINAELPPLRY